MQTLVEVKNLKKNYGLKEAVKGISFKIKDNEILGLLGPNGSGKTTTIGMMLGLLKPSNGEIIISKQFLEIKSNIDRAETEEISGNFAMSNWIYSNSLSMLNNFKKENPYWHTSVIDNMIIRVKSKIN